MPSSQPPGRDSEGPQLYRPATDRGSRLPSLRAIIIILLIFLLGLVLFLRSSRRSKLPAGEQTSVGVLSAALPRDCPVNELGVPGGI
ncbi:MAG TPA: hypothetical protein VIH17_08910 [Candidatus Acidoferrales bacterium]